MTAREAIARALDVTLQEYDDSTCEQDADRVLAALDAAGYEVVLKDMTTIVIPATKEQSDAG